MRPKFAPAALIVTSALALAGCGGVLDPKGPIGDGNRQLLVDSLVIMLAIVVPTIVATLVFAWWFRASNTKATYLPDWEFSGRIELVVWAIPAMTIVLLGGVTWIGSHLLDPAQPIRSANEGDAKALEVEVVSLDWKWLFIYPEQRVATVNELVIPAGRPVHFRLTSASVFNSFFVPQLGSMIYAMNGMATQLWLKADEPGTFRGLSAHYSGEGFSDMHFAVRAIDAGAFAQWVNRARENPEHLTGERYAALAKQSIADPPRVFGSVDRDLFARIVSADLAPGPGPGLEHEGAAQAPQGGHRGH